MGADDDVGHQVLDAQLGPAVDQEEPGSLPDGRRSLQLRIHKSGRRMSLYGSILFLPLF